MYNNYSLSIHTIITMAPDSSSTLDLMHSSLFPNSLPQNILIYSYLLSL